MKRRPKPTGATWRCHVCGATGTDGVSGWTRHYTDNHQDPQF